MQEAFNLIIACAGTGQRFKSSMPKQFFEVNKKTVLEYCLNQFEELPVGICVIAAHEDYIDKVKECTKNIGFDIKVIAGGKTRSHSVKYALKLI